MLLPPASAVAAWDFEGYLNIVSQAESDFDAANYAAAVDRYRQALGMLEQALAADEIPAEARDQALVEQKLLDYKLAVALQRNGDCDDAYANFERQAAAGEAPDVIRAALPVRLAESGACRVSTRLGAGDTLGAAETLTEVEADLVTYPVPETADAALQTEAQASRAELDAQRDSLANQLSDASVAAAEAGRCDEAASLLEQSEQWVPDGTGLERTRGAYDANCGLTYHDWAPWVVVGVGGVLFIVGVATEVGFNSDVDDFEAMRETCLGGSQTACDDALDMADDLESRRPIPATLMITGVLAMGGGVAWWLLTHTFDIREPDAVSVEPLIDPTRGSAGLGLRWSFDL